MLPGAEFHAGAALGFRPAHAGALQVVGAMLHVDVEFVG